MDVFDAIAKFQLTALSSDWVDNQWKQDFSTDKELPSEYALVLEDEDYGELLNNLCGSLKEWLTSNDGPNSTFSDTTGSCSDTSGRSDRRSWQTLLSSDINHKALVAVVSSFLKADVKELTDDVSRRLALNASRAYFLLLAIRGAQVFNVYNAVLFYQAVESLKVLNLLGESVDRARPKPAKGRKKKNADVEDPPEIEDTDVIHISNAEKAELVKHLIVALKDLKFCLSALPLKDEEDSLMSVVTALVSLARMEKTTSDFVERASKSFPVTYLAHRAYQTLLSLCVPLHGNVNDIIRIICRVLLPHMTMSAQEIHTNDKSKTIVRAHMISFIRVLLNNYGTAAHDSLQALVQQLCIRAPEKADIRARCVQQIFTLLRLFPTELFTKCTLWICSLAHADTVKNRMIGIEILSKLLNADEKEGEVSEIVVDREDTPEGSASADPEEEDRAEKAESDPIRQDDHDRAGGQSTTLYVSHKLFLSALLSRSIDVSPSVRSKCLGSFASLIFLKNPVMMDIMRNLFVSPYSHSNEPISNVIEEESRYFDFRLLFTRKKSGPPDRNPLPGGTRVVERIQLLAKDQKVFVRKSALNVLSNICRLNPKWITPERIEIMVSSCLDFSVAVRKMMIQCLTDLLVAYPDNDILVKAWVEGVFPLVTDNEVKCQEKAVEAVSSIILDNLVSHDHTANSMHLLPWKVINLLTLSEMRNVFRYVCRHWITSKRVGVKEMKILTSHIGTLNDLCAWYFIVCLSEFTDFHQPDTIAHYYLDNIYNKPSVREYCSQMVIEALLLNWRHMDPAVIDDLVHSKILVSLEQFALPLSAISPLMDICVQYNEGEFKTVAKRLISKCEGYLSKHVAPGCPADSVKSDVLSRHILTLGDASLICPGQVSQDTVSLMCNLIDDFLYMTEKKGWEGKVDSTCKAVTVTTLGKLCLQDEMLAKKLVPLLGTLLDDVTPTEVKLNTLTTMADLCVRFTSIVESYLGDMCVCLKDSDVRVRKTTLDLTIRLIQEDYVKLKCPYFYYVLHMLHDPEPKIRATTKSFIVNTVLTKNPKIMVQEFIQALYFLNDYDVHDSFGMSFSKNSMNPNERKAFMISGEGNREPRRALLCYMVEHMMDDHKFKTLNSICSEIFEAVCEDRIPLDNKGVPLVADAIFILGCDELKMCSSRNKTDEEEDDGSADKVETAIAIAVDALLKRIYQDNVMPTVIKLKRKLQEMKSALLKDLMVAIQALMKEYKDWMQEVLTADPTLQAEIELDMRVLNDEQEEQEEADHSEVPSLPVVHNDSEKFNPIVSLERLSASQLTIGGMPAPASPALSPRSSAAASASGPRVSLKSRHSPGPPTPSPVTTLTSDEDGSSLSQSPVKGLKTKPAGPPTPQKRGKKRMSSQSPSDSAASSSPPSDASTQPATSRKPKKTRSPPPKSVKKKAKKK